jgi:hypothetical protein
MSYSNCSITCKAVFILFAIVLGGSGANAQTKPSVPSPKVTAPAKVAAPAVARPLGGPTAAGHPAAVPGFNRPGANTANRNVTGENRAASIHANPAGGVAGRPTPEMNRPNMPAISHGGVAPSGLTESRGIHGEGVSRRVDGKPRDVYLTDRGMNVHHGLDGHRRIEVERADHSRIVAEHGGRGYIEHPYAYGGRDFGRRTIYARNGRIYDHYYGRYYYHGVYIHYYTPSFYYRPAFYGWAYNPWVAPVPYAWGWAANPWYGYYGYYFTPYPIYPSAAYWLTDYMIGASLAVVYQNQLEAATLAAQVGGPPPNAAPMTAEIKDMISAEVQRQIALENAEALAAQTSVPDAASSSIQRMLTDNVRHVFLIGHELDVVNSAGGECAISQGDALQLVGPPPPDSPTVSMLVLSSKGGIECRKNDTVSVQISDLQEMQNHMRETIQAGMGELQSKQGNGLPAIPIAARGEPVKATFMTDAPPPDANASVELKEQYNAGVAADQALVGTPQPGMPGPQTPGLIAVAPPAEPRQIEMGQTIDEVTAKFGQPISIIDLATKKVYVYKDIKITFKNGKMSDAQ